MAAHNFDPERTSEGEGAWLRNEVITPFATAPANKADLERYDQFGFGLQPEPGKIVLSPTTPGSSLAAGGAPNIADRSRMWRTWHTAVHEYLHNLVHPAFGRTVRGPVMREGFTEYFTKGVLTKAAPVAHQNQGLVAKVEGGIFSPPTTPALVGPYATPKSYAANLSHVENVAAKVPGGANAIRAAYFQGHVEKLGIDPATSTFVAAPPATFDPSLVDVPAGMTDLNDVALRTGVPLGDIRTANPALKEKSPLPPKLHLPQVREHKVVGISDAGGVVATEAAEQIAVQNGVSVDALKFANPAVNWGALIQGQKVLIPRH
jgi:hypothetical protein